MIPTGLAPLAVLVLAALVVFRFVFPHRMPLFGRFPAWSSPSRRVRYRRSIARSFLLFAGGAAAGLALVGRADAVWRFPAEFRSLAAPLPHYGAARDWPILAAMIGAMLFGSLFGALLTRLRKGRRPIMLGDVSSILPRNRAELGWGALLAVNAGISEELFFRLLLPLLLVLATGNALFGFAGGAAVFGLVHLYQGWVGVIATMLVGALLSFLYLASGSLFVPTIVHVLIDLNGLVLRPIMAGALRKAD